MAATTIKKFYINHYQTLHFLTYISIEKKSNLRLNILFEAFLRS